jgi:hypothetical protein
MPKRSNTAARGSAPPILEGPTAAQPLLKKDDARFLVKQRSSKFADVKGLRAAPNRRVAGSEGEIKAKGSNKSKEGRQHERIESKRRQPPKGPSEQEIWNSGVALDTAVLEVACGGKSATATSSTVVVTPAIELMRLRKAKMLRSLLHKVRWVVGVRLGQEGKRGG